MKTIYMIGHTKEQFCCFIREYKLNDIFKKYNLQWEKENPSYIIVHFSIYQIPLHLKELERYYNKKSIFIYWSDEYSSPDLNMFDYAAGFDRDLSFNDRYVRVPTQLRYRQNIHKEFLEKCYTKRELLQIKTKFCNFIYSNPWGAQEREFLFYEISKYKKVDSLGGVLNNVGNEVTRDYDDWDRRSIIERLPYKFSIIAENSTAGGYITEKIICAFQAKTIPIYWGDPSITEEFNPNAFINCHAYGDMKELRKKIEEIDTSEEKWWKMIEEPWQTEKQKEISQKEEQDYYNFWENIFSQNILESKRVAHGTLPDIYRKWFCHDSDSRMLKEHKIYEDWIKLTNIYKEGLGEAFEKNGIHKIGIYGMAGLGRKLYDALLDSPVEIVYCIDKAVTEYKGMKIKKLEDELGYVQVIIVTAFRHYESIKTSLQDKVPYKIEELGELLNRLLS